MITPPRARRATLLFAVSTFVFALVAVPRAEPAPGEAEVATVRFNSLHLPANPAGAWLEADVELNARPAPDSPGRMIPRVRVTLTLCFDIPGGTAAAPRRLEYYRAEAECVALENGRANVRFYLPPEIVKRDALRGDPRYWSAEAVSVAGAAGLRASGTAAHGRGARFSTSLAGEARKNFADKAATAAAANDGVLLPQYLTPFAHEYPRATPSFIRREAAR